MFLSTRPNVGPEGLVVAGNGFAQKHKWPKVEVPYNATAFLQTMSNVGAEGLPQKTRSPRSAGRFLSTCRCEVDFPTFPTLKTEVGKVGKSERAERSPFMSPPKET